MTGSSWSALLRRIPEKYHTSLAFSLIGGAEVVVQNVVRLEETFAVVQGRMSGSTDGGRVVIIPYSQINNLAFQQRMTEQEVQEVFGSPIEVSPPAPLPVAQAAPAPPQASAPLSEPAAMPFAQALAEHDTYMAPVESTVSHTPHPHARSTSKDKVKKPLPSKSILLARLRARLAEQGQG